MINNFIDRLGNWNPQFLRELKGRLQIRNIILAISISILGQFLLFISFQSQLPIASESITDSSNKYCMGTILYGLPQCSLDAFGNTIINWQLWWLDLFTWLSMISCFSLLVIGTYLIISDLATEERRGTLNFIRLSPQLCQSILVGKMLGVPILPYLTIALTIPLHLFAGLAANISLKSILSFDTIVLAACAFYYSAALLFGLVASWLGGFQAWLGSGVVLGFLILTKQWFIYLSSNSSAFIYWKFFNPFYFIPNLSDSSDFQSIYSLNDFYWFALPIGASTIILIGFTLANYIFMTCFLWLSLQRCFRNANVTMLSKKQSYFLTSYFSLVSLGCVNWQSIFGIKIPSDSISMQDNIASLLFLHFLLFLYLITAITPHRQALQDWARYRHLSDHKKLWNGYVIQDFIWGEKSPALVAIALNATIAIFSLSLLFLPANNSSQDKINAVYALTLAGSLAMIYAALSQLILFMKTRHRVLWAVGSLGAVIVLPIIILFILQLHENSFIWLFSVAAPLFALYTPYGELLSPITVLFTILAQGIILGQLIWQLRQKLKKAGESATKELVNN